MTKRRPPRETRALLWRCCAPSADTSAAAESNVGKVGKSGAVACPGQCLQMPNVAVCAKSCGRCVITMAEPFSIERRKLMRFMGAKAPGKAGKRLDFGVLLACPTLSWGGNWDGCPCQVIITPKAGKGTGMVAKAKELAEKHGWLLGATPSVCVCVCVRAAQPASDPQIC